MSPKSLNILLILTSFVLYFYVVKPLYTGANSGVWTPGEDSIQGLIAKKERYENTSRVVDDLIKKANKFKEEYEAFDAETLQNMSIMVPDSVNNLKLLSEMTKIARDNNLVIDGLGIRDKGGEYSVSFSMSATYQQFKELIKFYERSKRLLALQSVTFNPPKNEHDDAKFILEFSTYYLK
jgi:hypothetical protein